MCFLAAVIIIPGTQARANPLSGSPRGGERESGRRNADFAYVCISVRAPFEGEAVGLEGYRGVNEQDGSGWGGCRHALARGGGEDGRKAAEKSRFPPEMSLHRTKPAFFPMFFVIAAPELARLTKHK